MVGEQGLLALARSGLVPMLLAPAEARCSWGLLLCDLGLVSRALRAAFLDSDGFRAAYDARWGADGPACDADAARAASAAARAADAEDGGAAAAVPLTSRGAYAARHLAEVSAACLSAPAPRPPPWHRGKDGAYKPGKKRVRLAGAPATPLSAFFLWQRAERAAGTTTASAPEIAPDGAVCHERAVPKDARTWSARWAALGDAEKASWAREAAREAAAFEIRKGAWLRATRRCARTAPWALCVARAIAGARGWRDRAVKLALSFRRTTGRCVLQVVGEVGSDKVRLGTLTLHDRRALARALASTGAWDGPDDDARVGRLGELLNAQSEIAAPFDVQKMIRASRL